MPAARLEAEHGNLSSGPLVELVRGASASSFASIMAR